MEFQGRYLGGYMGCPYDFNAKIMLFDNRVEIVEDIKPPRYKITIPYNMVLDLQSGLIEETSILSIVGWAILGAIVLGFLFAFFSLTLFGFFGALTGLLVGALIGYSDKEKTETIMITFTESGFKHIVTLTSSDEQLKKLKSSLYEKIKSIKP